MDDLISSFWDGGFADLSFCVGTAYHCISYWFYIGSVLTLDVKKIKKIMSKKIRKICQKFGEKIGPKFGVKKGSKNSVFWGGEK